MGRINMFNFSCLALSVSVGIITGTKFFEPIVIDQLKRDGNLRTDIEIPEYNEDGEALPRTPVPENAQDIIKSKQIEYEERATGKLVEPGTDLSK